MVRETENNRIFTSADTQSTDALSAPKTGKSMNFLNLQQFQMVERHFQINIFSVKKATKGLKLNTQKVVTTQL